MPVTLQIGGTLVSGYIISPEQYLARAKDNVSKATVSGSVETGNSVRRVITDMFAHIEKLRTEHKESQKSEDAPLPEHIHLENVTILHGTHPVRLGDIPWRGRISEVEGFYFAALSVS